MTWYEVRHGDANPVIREVETLETATGRLRERYPHLSTPELPCEECGAGWIGNVLRHADGCAFVTEFRRVVAELDRDQMTAGESEER